MNRYDFDQLPDRRATESLKWLYYEKDVLPMWVADMDFRSPQPVIDALHRRIEHGVFGYPLMDDHLSETPGLCDLIVNWLAEHYRWHISPEDITYLPGVVTGFNLACHTFAAPGGGVLVQTPVYTPILKAAEHTGVIHHEMELIHDEGGRYAVDLDTFRESITTDTRLFILCNPHNPVGKVFSKQELEQMAEVCLDKGVLICSDEIHCELVYQGYRHVPIASLDPEIAQNTITLMSPSKTFNLAGLQCSFAVIQNPELRQKYLAARKGLVPWVNLMGLVAAKAAYEQGQSWLDQVLVYLEANRDYLADFVRDELPGIAMAKPEATYLAWLDCRQTGIDGNPYRFFLEQGRIAFNDGATFGKGGEGFVRLNFGCPRSMLKECLMRMKEVMEMQSEQPIR